MSVTFETIPPAALLDIDAPELHLRGMRLGLVLGQHKPVAARRSLRHPEGNQDARAEVLLPAAAGEFLHQQGRYRVEHRIVTEIAAEGVRGLDLRRQLQHILSRKTEVHEVGSRLTGKSRPVAEEILDAEVVGCELILELESGKQVLDLVVPLELALVHQLGHDYRSEGLGNRRDLEAGMLVHPARGSGEILDPESLGIYHLVVLDDGNGRTGDIPEFHSVLDISLDIGENVAFGSVVRIVNLGLQRRRGHERGKNESQ